MRRRVQMTDVIALDLKARSGLAARLQDVRDIAEGIAKHQIIGVLEIGPLPVVAEFLEASQQLVHAEVHRAHVERGDLGARKFERASAAPRAKESAIRRS